eukprot:1494823-Prymnesium_polylepis.1
MSYIIHQCGKRTEKTVSSVNPRIFRVKRAEPVSELPQTQGCGLVSSLERSYRGALPSGG